VVEGRRLSVLFRYLAWRLWKKVVALAVILDTVSGRVLRRQSMPVFEWHRLTFIGCRLDKRRLSGRGRTTIFCVFPVFSVAVIEKSCGACGDRNYYFRSGILVSADVTVLETSTVVDRNSIGHTVAQRS
jgi:hypothetical protein